MTKHTCHWPGCPREVPPAMWGCREHWFKLPKPLRDAVWREYRPGQEITKTPSVKYLAVAALVQGWIAGKVTVNRDGSLVVHEALQVMSMNDDSPNVIGADLPPMPTQDDRREAYKRLYVLRMVEKHGLDEADAVACFEAGEIDYDTPPEDAADDEVSYWDADE